MFYKCYFLIPRFFWLESPQGHDLVTFHYFLCNPSFSHEMVWFIYCAEIHVENASYLLMLFCHYDLASLWDLLAQPSILILLDMLEVSQCRQYMLTQLKKYENKKYDRKNSYFDKIYLLLYFYYIYHIYFYFFN